MSRFLLSARESSVRWCARRATAVHRCHARLVLHRGYIANRAALVGEARARRIALGLDGDAELFALAAQWWGPELVRHVLGEYAAVVADPETGALLAVHDALGVVPLFYGWRDNHTFIVATHLEDACTTCLDNLDEEYVADYLAIGHVSSERTPYRSLKRLLPGEAVVHAAGATRVAAIWNLSQIEPAYPGRCADDEERLRALLDQAVRAATAATGTVWCELSGGLDSSTVAAMVVPTGVPLELISVVYSRTQSADERPWMRAFLGRYALPWHTVDGDEYPPFSELPSRFYAEPDFAAIVATWHRRYEEEARSRGVEILLTGIGGDAVFGGASVARPAPVRGDRWWFTRRHGHVRPPVPPWIDPEYARRVCFSGRRWHPRGRPEDLALERTALLVGQRGQGVDAVAFRHPLLYRPLVEFMIGRRRAGVDGPSEDRALQRRSLRGILPDLIRLRKGGRGPLEPYIQGLRQSVVVQSLLVDQPILSKYGVIRLSSWKDAVARARFGHFDRLVHFEATATLELWLRQRETVCSHQGDDALNVKGELSWTA